MKISKLKYALIVACSLIVPFCPKTQATEEFSGEMIRKAYSTMRSIADETEIFDGNGNKYVMTISGIGLDNSKNKNLPEHIIGSLGDKEIFKPEKAVGRSELSMLLLAPPEKMISGASNSINLNFEPKSQN